MRLNAPYRTSVSQVYEQTIYKTVREILPGEVVSPEDPFLIKFVEFVKMSGFMSFDTERKKHPVMVQVIIIGFHNCSLLSVFRFQTLLIPPTFNMFHIIPRLFSSVHPTGSFTFFTSHRRSRKPSETWLVTQTSSAFRALPLKTRSSSTM